VIEDAAQAIDSYYNGKPLGSIGDMAAFSFHETKNIISGEGGMITVNNPKFISRAEIIREKGTNRSAFFRGEVDKYGWVDIGSSFLPSEIIAAFLYAQLEHLDEIQKKRKKIWDTYYKGLNSLEKEGKLSLPVIPGYATNNAHMFYILCRNLKERSGLIAHLKKNDILSVFHYLSLHKSPYYNKFHDGRKMPNSDRYTNCLLRLPLYYELSASQQDKIINTIREFYS
jgi:dTDP-4-amino-4,6-dideoxygalactose transaminase